MKRITQSLFFSLLLAVAGLMSCPSCLTAAAQDEPPGTNALSGTNVLARTSRGTNNLVENLVRIDKQSLTFGLDRVDWLREHSFLGQPLWKYLASLLFIFLAFYLAKILDMIVNAWLKKWASKTQTIYDDLIISLLHGPVKVVTFVIFLHVGLNVFDWPERAQLWLSKGLIIVVACSLTYVCTKLADMLIALWLERVVRDINKDLDRQLVPVLRKSIKAFIIVVALLVTASNLGMDITGALASLSIGGLALGLAAQDTLANLFGAVAVYLDRPFRIGDRIRIDQVDGNVEQIGLRSTQVRNADGFLVTIPNKTVAAATITNISRRPSIRTDINMPLPLDTPVEKIELALGILRDVMGGHPKTDDVTICFNRFGDASLNISINHVFKGVDWKAHLAAMEEMNLSIKRRFAGAGIEFPSTTKMVFVNQDASRAATNETPKKFAS
jgi:MscS family membrane protein